MSGRTPPEAEERMGDRLAGLGAALGHSTLSDVRDAARAAVEQARRGLSGQPPGLALVAATVDYPAAALFFALRELLPEVPIHGMTSAIGVLGSGGVLSSLGGQGGSLGILLLAGSPQVRFATGHAELGSDPRLAGQLAAAQLLDDPNNPGEHAEQLPQLVLVHASPGHEEALLAGIGDRLPGVPVFGGSAADHAISGSWSVFTSAGPRSQAVSVAAIFGPVAVAGTLLTPYRPAGPTATVTQGAGRQLRELDGEPAAHVLNRWLSGSLELQVAEGGNILAQTALRPLARRSQGHHLLLHPSAIHLGASGSAIELFASLPSPAPGTELCLMEGSVDGLLEALGELVPAACASGRLPKEAVRAALLFYCAGCAGIVGPRLDAALRRHLRQALGDIPLLGMCSFGEQGFIPEAGNVHQNLSIGLVLIAEAA